MYLGIDNSEEEKIIFFKWENNDFLIEEKPMHESRDLLLSLRSLLTENNLSFQDLEGLAVRTGAGKFTSTRVAVTVVNTLGFALKIPVVGVGVITKDTVEKIREASPGIYVSATYSGEPNIGKKKE